MRKSVLLTRTKLRTPWQDKVLHTFAVTVITLFCLFCVLPIMVIISSSFETESVIIREGYSLFPKIFTTDAYQVVFASAHIYRAYGVTIFTTFVGTILAMFMTITLAYPLSLKKVKFRNPITFFVYFTMLFNGGLVPTYILISRTLGLRDNIWVLILPMMFSAWNMFLMRNFFQALPEELPESAYMDGANDLTILFKIMLPISTPGIATISLFYALGFWNQWFNAMLYLNDRTMMPLQYLIMDLVRSADAIREMAQMTGIPTNSIPANSLRMATTLVTIGPIILLYPFAQRYFTRGLTVGAIKG